MGEAGFIDEATRDQSLEQPVDVEQGSVDTSEAPYFVDLVRTQLHQRYDPKDLTTQNLSIYTSLDLTLQTLAQDALTRGLASVEKMIKRKGERPPVQGSLIALEPTSGAVVALVGGRSYGRSQYNRVVEARRQPGQHLQALRVPRRLRGHLRRRRPAPHHPRHGGRRRARGLLLRGQGVHPAELRGQVPGLRHPAPGPRQQPERGHGQGGGDGGLRADSRSVGEEAGHRSEHPALPCPRPRRVRGHALPDGHRLQRPRQRRAQDRARHRAARWPTTRTG